ncbi:ABC transporter permease [Jeotgalicoccus psychrophilus]|uniref:ABC transporter permease n=1 Tax=Jeotgalicoccus psychrophilus TaxID=157228 RepID=UPI0003F8E567|nr:ABC transporter permease [Jeotgalicoccus psychrophilus]
MKLFKWDFLKIIRDWKVRILLVSLFLFLASYSAFYQDRSIVLPQEELRSEYEDTQQIFHAIPQNHFDSAAGQEVYDKLARQQSIIGMQRYILGEQEGNTVSGLENVVSDYVDQGLELAENRLFFYEADDFESQELLLSFMPAKAEIENDLKFLTYLKEHNVDIDWNPMSPSLVLFNLVNIVAGIFIFVIAAIFGADRFSRDQEFNWSISQGIPYSWAHQWRQRTFISWGLIWLIVLAGICVSYILSTLFTDSGTLNYPVPLYSGEETVYISIMQYVILALLLTMALSYIIVKLSTGLSWVFRNIYLTITIVTAVFYLPYVFALTGPAASWNPFLYLQIIPVLEGSWESLKNVTVTKLIISIAVLYIIVEIVFHFIFKLIPTRTGKLERRRN